MTENINDNDLEIRKVLTAECRREFVPGNCSGCMDDRELLEEFADSDGNKIEIPTTLSEVIVTSEKELGVQMPGGALLKMVVLVQHAPENEKLIDQPDTFEELYRINEEAHKRAQVKPGVHMDNNHGGLEAEVALAVAASALEDPDNTDLLGCGYGAMLRLDTNPLELNRRASKFFKENNSVPKMVYLGSKLAELAGHHANQKSGEAFAIMNTKPNTTLDHKKLKEKGLKVYNYDTGKSDEVTMHLVDVLNEMGKTEWANNIEENGIAMEREHYRKASLALAGMEPVAI